MTAVLLNVNPMVPESFALFYGFYTLAWYAVIAVGVLYVVGRFAVKVGRLAVVAAEAVSVGAWRDRQAYRLRVERRGESASLGVLIIVSSYWNQIAALVKRLRNKPTVDAAAIALVVAWSAVYIVDFWNCDYWAWVCYAI